MGTYNLKQGYNIPLAGEPERNVVDAARPQTVAICPTDFPGIKTKPAIDEGQPVKIGTPLVCEKNDETHVICSPVSGTVKEIRRGNRRVITHVVIENDGKYESESFERYDTARIAALPRETVLAQVKRSGLLALFRERPFNNTARPSRVPRDIFISTFDTSPLAPDMELVLDGQGAAFQAGLEVCRRLTTGDVHLGIDGKGKVNAAFSGAQNVKIHQFAGAHPAGNVGVHIHHVAPIRGRTDYVWTIGVAGVVMLGKLFTTGKLDMRQIVALCGTGATERKHFRTVVGAPLSTLIGGRTAAGELRIISGNALSGQKIGADEYLRYP